jgi:hypothetical protein
MSRVSAAPRISATAQTVALMRSCATVAGVLDGGAVMLDGDAVITGA